MPLAEKLAKQHNFSLPYYNESTRTYPREYYARPFLVATFQDDPNDFDDGHGVRQVGSSEWAESAQDACARVRRMLEWRGYRQIKVYDVERQEECSFEFGIRLKYQAVATLYASVGDDGCFDNSPSLGGR